MGSGGFIITYLSAGIFGFAISVSFFVAIVLYFLPYRNVLGGNFSLVGVPSIGASGAIFGTVAVRLQSEET